VSASRSTVTLIHDPDFNFVGAELINITGVIPASHSVVLGMPGTLDDTDDSVTFVLGQLQSSTALRDATSWGALTFRASYVAQSGDGMSSAGSRPAVDVTFGHDAVTASTDVLVVEPLLAVSDHEHNLDASDPVVLQLLVTGALAVYNLEVHQNIHPFFVLNQSDVFGCIYDGPGWTSISDAPSLSSRSDCTGASGGAVIEPKIVVGNEGTNVTWFLDRPLISPLIFHGMIPTIVVDDLKVGESDSQVATLRYTSTPYAGSCCVSAKKPGSGSISGTSPSDLMCCPGGSWESPVSADESGPTVCGLPSFSPSRVDLWRPVSERFITTRPARNGRRSR
jgi:hypothetical protein